MIANRNYRRKNYFINKKFQGRYMFNFYLLLILLLLIFTLLLSFNTAQQLTITYDNFDLQVGSTPAVLFRHILTASWIIMIPLGLVLAWVVMRHTHRVAGPLYKFETVLEQMSRGIIDQHVQLRESDDGQEVMARLREVNRFLAVKIGDIGSLAERLREDPAIADSPELQGVVNELQQALAEFEIKK